jgi:hypothetical protein
MWKFRPSIGNDMADKCPLIPLLGVTTVAMFDHPLFAKHPFEEVPLDRDVYLMDEEWLEQYEAAMVGMFNGAPYDNVGYISYAAIRRVEDFALELSWYPNVFDRFHEVTVWLPRDQFITCVDCWQYDEKPHIFVKSGWLTNLHLRPFSAFALIDAIDVKKAIARHELTKEKLIELRGRVDELASNNPGVSFVSFADSLLLKSNWYVGTFNSKVEYTYEPETLLKLFPMLAHIYDEVLGLRIYGVLTQGLNEYYDQSLLHISASSNHVCLNSLGLPFAQLLAIDNAVRVALKEEMHKRADLYIDEHFYHSLRFRFGFDKRAQISASYRAPLSASAAAYFVCDIDTILNNLDTEKSARKKKK